MLLLNAGEVTLEESERARLSHFFRELAEQRRRENDAFEAARKAEAKKAARNKPIAKEALDEVHDMPAAELEPRVERTRGEYGGLNFRRIRPRPRS